MKNKVKVLSIDGGGIRGIIPSLLLAEIEKRTGKHISELFDLIAGSSTGGIIALGLNTPDDTDKPKYTAQDIADFYIEKSNQIFARSTFRKVFSFIDLFRPKYSAHGFEENIGALVGKTKLSESITEVLIPSYEIESRQTVFFKSNKVKKDQQDDYYMKDVARATGAAPTYFPCAQISPVDSSHKSYMIDGDTFASDPAMCAYAEAKNMFPEMETIILVSLGTGSFTKPIPYKKAKNWGSIFWITPIVDVLFDGMPDTVEYQIKKILSIGASSKQHFFRLQPELSPTNDSLDDVSLENVNRIKKLAEKLIQEKSEVIDDICKLLTATDN